MKRAFILLLPMLLLVACGNTEALEQTIAEQDDEIMEKQKEIESLKQELKLKDEIETELLNDVYSDYQYNHDEFDADLAIDMWNAEGDEREALIDDVRPADRWVYKDFFKEIEEIEELFEG